MNRDFAVLGLREDATKEQVKQAYEKRSGRYRTVDYADDAAYVNKKIAQLKSAYERAYAIAQTPAVKSNNTEPTSQDRYDRPAYKPREYKPEKYNHDEFERGRRRAVDKVEGHVRMPDLHKLKDMAKSTTQGLKETVTKKMDNFNWDGDTPDQEFAVSLPKTEPEATQMAKAVEPPPGEDTYGNSGSELAPTTAKSSDNGGLVKVIIGIVIAMVILMTQCIDSNDSSDWENGYETSYSYTYNNPEDEAVYDIAQMFSLDFYDNETVDSYKVHEYSQEELEAASNEFAKRYFDMERIQDKAAQLYDSYGEFSTDGTDSAIDKTVEEVLAFYGFPRFVESEGWLNPYNNNPITSLVEYLGYLSQYYDHEVKETKKGA